MTSHVATDVNLENRHGQKALTVARIGKIKALLHDASAESHKYIQALANRVDDEVKYLKEDLNRTRVETDAEIARLKQDKRWSEMREQVKTLKETQANVPKLESHILNLMSRIEQLEARDKEKSALIRKLKAEIAQIHNENQALINKVHRLQVKEKRRDIGLTFDGN